MELERYKKMYACLCVAMSHAVANGKLKMENGKWKMENDPNRKF